MLQPAKNRAAPPQAERTECLDRQHSPRPDFIPPARPENRMGREIRTGEGQSDRRLDIETGLALSPRTRRALQLTSRSELSKHWLHALHARRPARRGPQGGTLARHWQDG